MPHHITNSDIEKRADSILAGKSRVGAALRDAAGRRSLKLNVLGSLGLGLIDSTQKASGLEASSVSKTGVGYKAWAGAGLLAVGAIANMIGEESKSDKKFKQAEMVADVSLTLSNTTLGIEAYNLGVTRFGRVQAVASQLTNGAIPPPAAVTGLPDRGRRGGNLRRRAAQLGNIAERFITADNAERVADVFGFDIDLQDALLGGEGAIEEDDEYLLPAF